MTYIILSYIYIHTISLLYNIMIYNDNNYTAFLAIYGPSTIHGIHSSSRPSPRRRGIHRPIQAPGSH